MLSVTGCLREALLPSVAWNPIYRRALTCWINVLVLPVLRYCDITFVGTWLQRLGPWVLGKYWVAVGFATVSEAVDPCCWLINLPGKILFPHFVKFAFHLVLQMDWTFSCFMCNWCWLRVKDDVTFSLKCSISSNCSGSSCVCLWQFCWCYYHKHSDSTV